MKKYLFADLYKSGVLEYHEDNLFTSNGSNGMFKSESGSTALTGVEGCDKFADKFEKSAKFAREYQNKVSYLIFSVRKTLQQVNTAVKCKKLLRSQANSLRLTSEPHSREVETDYRKCEQGWEGMDLSPPPWLLISVDFYVECNVTHEGN